MIMKFIKKNETESNERDNLAFLVDKTGKHMWEVDSGNSPHITNSKELFSKFSDAEHKLLQPMVIS